ncbi:MAG: LysM peptidoglycan-binding domain-containing protein [Clostridium sp.]|nr:LysM peptidoglycan-binding domain-containing protein [Clostridium sp.]
MAELYGTTWQHLAEINNLSNPNYIYPGEVIKIR